MSLFLGGEFQGLDNSGNPLAGGKVYTYDVGTTNAKDSYSDTDLSVANTNPVVLDANGRADIFLAGDYKIRLTDSSDVLIYERDGLLSNTYFGLAQLDLPDAISVTDWTIPDIGPSSGRVINDFTIDMDSLSGGLTMAKLDFVTATDSDGFTKFIYINPAYTGTITMPAIMPSSPDVIIRVGKNATTTSAQMFVRAKTIGI